MNNLLLLVQTNPENIGFLTLFEAPNHSGNLDLSMLMPDQWNGQFKPHFYRIEDYVSDLMVLGSFDIPASAMDTYRADGVSRVAFIESPTDGDGSSIRFGGERITEGGFIAYYSETQQTYKFLHCKMCAMGLASWLTKMQKEWTLNAGVGLQEAQATRH